VYVSSTTILIPKDEKIWRGKNTYGAHAHCTADTQEPTASCTHNNTQHTTQINIKHHHHGPLKPPASRGSNFIGECNHRTLHNRSRSLQHGDVLFIDDTNFSFIYLTIILCAMRAHWLSWSRGEEQGQTWPGVPRSSRRCKSHVGPPPKRAGKGLRAY
jgi:hypothetical protein